MLSKTLKVVIIRALLIRQQNGEDPAEAVKDYIRLTASEQAAILEEIRGGQENG